MCVFANVEQSETQQKAEAAPEDSDLDRKRRETEALLQSIGISPEPPLGTVHRPLDRTEISICTAAISLDNACLQKHIRKLPFYLCQDQAVLYSGFLYGFEWDFIQTLYSVGFSQFLCLMDFAF